MRDSWTRALSVPSLGEGKGRKRGREEERGTRGEREKWTEGGSDGGRGRERGRQGEMDRGRYIVIEGRRKRGTKGEREKWTEGGVVIEGRRERGRQG